MLCRFLVVDVQSAHRWPNCMRVGEAVEPRTLLFIDSAGEPTCRASNHAADEGGFDHSLHQTRNVH